jgi:hypothetical protein
MAAAMETAIGFGGMMRGEMAPDVSDATSSLPALPNETDRERREREAAVRNVDWPDMQLNGVLVGSEDWKGSVILDSEMVPLNASVKGMKVVAVQDYGAWIEKDGVRKYVAVHQRTR